MLVALDLDGTVLREDKTVSERVRRSIADVTAAGFTVVLVTARHWLSVEEIAERAGVEGLLICSNGAVVYDRADGRVHHEVHLDLATARAFITEARAAIPDVGIAWETSYGGCRDSVFHSLAELIPGPYADRLQFLEDVADDHAVTKVNIGHARLRCHELIERLPADHHGLRLWNSGGWFAECTSGEVSKANALEKLCGELAIAATDVIAIGDQPVDLPMLQWAGRGVAMANAHPDVLAATTEHTASNEDDGVALILESLIR